MPIRPIQIRPTSMLAARAHGPARVTPRLLSGGITDALLADHNAARALIAQIQANPRTAPVHYPRLSSALRRHDKAESMTLYRALSRFPQIEAQMRRSEREHAALGGMLRRLDATPYNHPIWSSRFAAVVAALKSHLAVEESDVFAFTRARLSDAQQRALAARYRSIMQSMRTPAPVRVERKISRAVVHTSSMFDRALTLLLPLR